MSDAKEKVTAIFEPLVRTAGFEIAEVTLSLYKSNVTIRLFLYGEAGVSIDDCTSLSRSVSAALEASGMYPDGYALEVSSAGLDRPLKTGRDFHYRIGETVKVEFKDGKQKRLTARIVASDEESVELESDQGKVSIGLDSIRNAKIVF